MIRAHDFIYVRKNEPFEKFEFAELIFVKAMLGYMQVVTENLPEVYTIVLSLPMIFFGSVRRLLCKHPLICLANIPRVQRLQYDNNQIIIKRNHRL